MTWHENRPHHDIAIHTLRMDARIVATVRVWRNVEGVCSWRLAGAERWTMARDVDEAKAQAEAAHGERLARLMRGAA